jgi:hypothetical protein
MRASEARAGHSAGQACHKSWSAYAKSQEWAGLSGAFFLLSVIKTARGLGLLRGFGDFLRGIFKQRGWYEDRRSLQIAASIAVAVVVMALVVWGLRWTWHRIKRYRLAVGFAGLTVGFGIIRFISLHEVDAWDANAPWARTAVDLVAAAGVSAVAIARLCQLRNFSRTSTPGITRPRRGRQRC